MKKELAKAGDLAQEQLGERIKVARKSAGLTAEEFAKRLGVTSKTVRGWEKSRRVPRANQIVMMAGLLNVTGDAWNNWGSDKDDATYVGDLALAQLGLERAEVEEAPAE